MFFIQKTVSTIDKTQTVLDSASMFDVKK